MGSETRVAAPLVRVCAQCGQRDELLPPSPELTDLHSVVLAICADCQAAGKQFPCGRKKTLPSNSNAAAVGQPSSSGDRGRGGGRGHSKRSASADGDGSGRRGRGCSQG